MLESEFSLQMEDLMEEHLEKNNSIPMFLAAVIKKLFDKQNRVIDVDEYKDGDDEEEEDDEEEDEDEEDDEEEDRSQDSSNENSNDSDEIIEIDDD